MTALAWVGGYFAVGTALAGLDWLLVGRRMALRGTVESAALAWILAWPLMLAGMTFLIVREGAAMIAGFRKSSG